MDITQIPFVSQVGLEYTTEGILKLEPAIKVQNHMQTIHASAQFTLAETQSGLTLQETFPELEDKVVALLRSANVKFRSPATSEISAEAHINPSLQKKFINQLNNKGRASIVIQVKLRDSHGIVTMEGEYSWYIQKT